MSLRFTIGVIAELWPAETLPLKERSWVDVTRASYDALRTGGDDRFEANWLGLRLLLEGVSEFVAVKVLNASKQEIYRDLMRAASHDQSGLFKLVHDGVFGVLGVAPFGMLVTDWELEGSAPRDVALLERMSSVAAAIHAPVLAAAGPGFFDASTDPAKLWMAPSFSKWNAFRKSEDARFVGLTVARMRMREGLWGSAVWALASCFDWEGRYAEEAPVALKAKEEEWSFPLDEWFDGGFREVIGGAFVAHPFDDDLIRAMDRPASSFGMITGFAPVTRPERLRSPVSALDPPMALSHVLAISRYAIGAKVLVRDRGQPFESVKECERELREWIARFVEEGSLRSAHVEVVRDGQGVCRAIIRAVPGPPLEELPWGLRGIAVLPAGRILKVSEPDMR